MEQLGQPPSYEDVIAALRSIKYGKAPGSSDILPEMVKVVASNMGFVLMLKEKMTSVWDERKVPKEWINAILISIHNLRSCDNWQGRCFIRGCEKGSG